MAQKIKKFCKVCGSEYEVCYSCDKKHSWMMHTDTEDHFYIFGVLMEYQVNRNANQAYKALRKRGVDFRDTTQFLPGVQNILAEIYTLAHENSSAKKVVVEATEVKAAVLAKNEAIEQNE